MLVISSGIAADGTQLLPGPNGGPAANQTNQHVPYSLADLNTCTEASCITDWLYLPNPPLKLAGQLPESPACPGVASEPEAAYDSVMLTLRLRAPTNVRGFSLKGAFFSVEYPEFVCTDYNDQLVVLVDTPTPTWPLPNPPDKNLMTYLDGVLKYPVGINVAAATSLFSACEPPGTNALCQDAPVSGRSCSAGLAPLLGTGFEKPPGSFPACAWGGATRWLTTRGNVVPGAEFTLRLAVWDVGDQIYDSTALLDEFHWELAPQAPGTD
jgi:hypothetical protein